VKALLTWRVRLRLYDHEVVVCVWAVTRNHAWRRLCAAASAGRLPADVERFSAPVGSWPPRLDPPEHAPLDTWNATITRLEVL